MIQRVIIENFKSIKKADVNIGRINVLIGANGAGKSNFILFLEMVKAVMTNRLESYVLSRDISRLMYNGLKSSVFGGLVDFDNEYVYSFRLKPNVSGEKAFVDSYDTYYNIYGDETKTYSGKWFLSSSRTSTGMYDASNKLVEKFVLKEYGKDMMVYHFNDTTPASPMRNGSRIDDNKYLRDDASNLASVLYHIQQTDQRSFRAIQNAIRQVTPYFEALTLAPDRNGSDKVKIEWEEKGTDAYRDAHDFSDGTIRFVALATLLLQPNPPQTIIIDEPELGLHPSAINILGALVRKASYKAQIILSTQSVNLVDNFEPQDIIVTEHRNGTSTFCHLDEAELAVWLEDYSLGEIWSKNIIGGQP